MAPRRIGALLVAASCAALNDGAAAMVIAPRPRAAPARSAVASPLAPPPSRTATARKRFRIRRTRASDLDAISSMLAEESVPSGATPNWNDGVKRLRAKSQFEKQLAHRLVAIEEGRKVEDRMKQQCADIDDLCALSDDDTCHVLWTNDNFRSKLRNAVLNSQEANAWTEHGFELTPRPEMLHHVMLTVEDTASGEVAGFSEVAWLPTPISALQQNIDAEQMQTDDDLFSALNSYDCQETSDSYCDALSTQPCESQEDRSMQCAPAIVNLVTAQSHRRMGVASSVLNFASKYTRTQWRCGDDASNALGLYVHPENESARRLYRNKGFSVVSAEGDEGLLYMTQRS